MHFCWNNFFKVIKMTLYKWNTGFDGWRNGLRNHPFNVLFLTFSRFIKKVPQLLYKFKIILMKYFQLKLYVITCNKRKQCHQYLSTLINACFQARLLFFTIVPQGSDTYFLRNNNFHKKSTVSYTIILPPWLSPCKYKQKE